MNGSDYLKENLALFQEVCLLEGEIRFAKRLTATLLNHEKYKDDKELTCILFSMISPLLLKQTQLIIQEHALQEAFEYACQENTTTKPDSLN